MEPALHRQNVYPKVHPVHSVFRFVYDIQRKRVRYGLGQVIIVKKKKKKNLCKKLNKVKRAASLCVNTAR